MVSTQLTNNMSNAIAIPKILVIPVLFFTQFFPERICTLMCRGYNEDEDFTALYWRDDRENANYYFDYQIWIGI